MTVPPDLGGDIPRRTGAGAAPLSYGQELLWLVDRASPGTTAWNVARPFRVHGRLDLSALQRAFDSLVERHEALRTVFAATVDGPRQLVEPPGPAHLRVETLNTGSYAERRARAEQMADTEAGLPFDLARDWPLRVLSVTYAPGESLLCITTHHIVSDGWSKSLMFSELSALYEAFRGGRAETPAALPLQYGDYAAWERSPAQQSVLSDDLAYWRTQLAGIPPSLELPTDRPRPQVPGFDAGRSVTVVSNALLAGLSDLARRHDVTLYMVLLSAYVALLHRYSGQDDVVVGSPIVGRAYPETEALIGYFANTLIVRSRLEDDPTFAQLLARVRETCLDAFDRQAVPVERLVLELQKDRRLSQAPLFNVILTMEDVLEDELRLGEARLEPIEGEQRATKFDLTLLAARQADGLRLTLWYRKDLFVQVTADRLLAHLRRLLEGVLADPGRRVGSLPLLSDAERRAAVTGAPPPSGSDGSSPVHEQFAAVARRTPERDAVVCGDERLTYGELEARASELARRLRLRGARTGSLVGLALDRSPEALVAMLAILKAGGAFVPLPPDLPTARRATMLGEAGVHLIVGRAADRERFPAGELLCIDESDPPASAGALGGSAEVAEDQSVARPGTTAYVVFTSGSTGVPKGVAVTHRNLANYTAALLERLEADPERPYSFATVSSLGADLGYTAIFPALSSGGTLHVVPAAVAADAADFSRWSQDHPVDVLKVTPAHASVLFGAGGSARLPRRWLVLGGEASSWELVARLQALGDCRILNHYGPTETTIGACAFEVRDVPDAGARPATVPIGTPLAGVAAYALDRLGELLPAGVPGELFVGGAGVAAGYVNRPDLTAERFLPDPFAGGFARMYRTGDRVKRSASGELEFLGRLDGQVKVRGYRVELGEIEAVLAAHPQVAHAAAVLHGAGSDAAPAAYVVLSPGAAADEPANPGAGGAPALLRAWLAERLPDYMLPTVVVLDELPLMPNGKLDRAALPDPAELRPRDAYVAPRTATEEKIARIWAQTLDLERVGVTENFLALGFHSILAIRALDTLGQTFDVRVPIRSFFEAPTIAEFAAVVDEALVRRTRELEAALAAIDLLSDAEAEALVSAQHAGGCV